MKKLRMPSVSFIVARSRSSHVIGCDNQLPWRLKSDLRRFRQLTSLHAVIMGRKTFESIGHRLPNRLNVVLSRDEGFADNLSHSSLSPEGLNFVRRPEDALMVADKYSLFHDASDIFVIGGEEIYKLFLSLVNTVYLTEVEADVRGDAHFDEEFRRVEWKVSSKQFVEKSEIDEYNQVFFQLDKINKRFRYREIKKVSASRIQIGSRMIVRKRLIQANNIQFEL